MPDNIPEKCTDKSSVVLVDDHALVRRGFRRMLDDDATLEVVGEASDGVEAVQLAAKLKPQVIVMDCQLPQMTGLEATRKILREQPNTAILMLSMHSEDTLVRQSLEAGARGYVLKNALDLDLARAIRSDGVEAVQLAAKLKPQVIVMDCQLPQMTGLEATRKILREQPNTAILMLSMHSEDTLVRQSLEAGARGYVLKNALDLDLARAI